MKKLLGLLFKASTLKCPGDRVQFIFIYLIREVLFLMELWEVICILQYMLSIPQLIDYLVKDDPNF